MIIIYLIETSAEILAICYCWQIEYGLIVTSIRQYIITQRPSVCLFHHVGLRQHVLHKENITVGEVSLEKWFFLQIPHLQYVIVNCVLLQQKVAHCSKMKKKSIRYVQKVVNFLHETWATTSTSAPEPPHLSSSKWTTSVPGSPLSAVSVTGKLDLWLSYLWRLGLA